MKVKTALAFFFDTFLFQIMPTNATIAVHLDFLYATQFSTILLQAKVKKDRVIVYTGYDFQMSVYKIKRYDV
ncbi:MAG: hypothetical protein ACYDAJ_03405 [Nitrosotalea sp.]